MSHLERLPATKACTRLHRQFTQFLPRVAQVIEQTERRILDGESVPSAENLVSRFEAHADVLVKDRRATYSGHKVFVTTGRSNLILDCVIPKGNPVDATWTVALVRRQQRLFERPPR